MDVLIDILNFIVAIFKNPALLLGIITGVGLYLQKRPGEQVLTSSIKAAIGVLLILAGSGLIVDAVGPINTIISTLRHTPPVEVTVGTDNIILEYGSEIGLAIILGFALNLILARLTPFKYVMLTGHLIFWDAFWFLVIFRFVGGITGIGLILATGIWIGLRWIYQPFYTHFFDEEVNGKAGFVLGHTASLPVLFTGLISKPLGKAFGLEKKEEKSEEEISAIFRFFRDPYVFLPVVYALLYLILVIFDWSLVASVGGMNPILYAILQGLSFGAGFAVLMQGVRMLIGELIPAFTGFAEKVVPNAKPALDCPLFFPYSATGMAIGGFVGVVTMVLMSLLFTVMGYPYFVYAPTMSAWFHGATAGVYGDHYAGKVGIILGGIIAGVLMAVGSALLIPIVGFAVGDFLSWAADTDYVIYGLLLAWFLMLFK